MPRVLLVSYGGGHIPMTLALIDELRAACPEVHIDLIALTTAHAVATRSHQLAWRYTDLQHLADSTFVAHWGVQLAEHTCHPDVTAEETQSYIGVNLWSLAQQHGLDSALKMFREHGRYAFMPLAFFHRVLAYFQPDVVVATVSPRSEEAALQAALEIGIPCLSMTDMFLRPFDPYCHRTVYADVVTVINQQVADVLEAAGVPHHALRVTGNPAFDGLKDPLLLSRAQELRNRLGWSNIHTIALWAGHADYLTNDITNSPVTDYPRAVEAELRRWVEADEGRAMVVRYHPNEAHLFPQDEEHPRIVWSGREQHVHEVIALADVVIVQRSTVGLEAAIAGKPVVALTHSPLCLRDDFDYERLGIAYAVTEIKDLPRAIFDALQKGCAAPALAALPPAAPQLAQLVLELAHPSHRRA